MNASQQKEIYIGGEKFTASHAVVQNEASKNFGRAYWFVRDADGKFIYFHWDQHFHAQKKPHKSLKRTLSACLEKILTHDSPSTPEEKEAGCPVLKKLRTSSEQDDLVQKLLDLVDGLSNPLDVEIDNNKKSK